MKSTQRVKDKELITKACNDDAKAMEQLLKRYQKKTLGMVHNYVDTHADAQDITQDVLIKLYQSLSSFQFNASFTTWHYRIVINAINSYFRQSSQRLFSMAMNLDDFDSDTLPNQSSASPEQLLQAEQTLKNRLKKFAKLPIETRDIMSRRDINGDSYEDIAIQKNCPIGTIRSRIHRARIFLNEE